MTHVPGRSSLVERGRGQYSPFFQSKFRVPMTPRHAVRRPRLHDLLDDLMDYPVTAIVAPAGAGKTVLAADWVRRAQHPCAWLTLDEADRDTGQFWTALTSALDELAPGLAARTEASRGVLVIDDVHRIEGHEDACAALTSFARHKPPWLHLVLLSRHRLPLPVDRWRAAGELADVHFDVLRMSDDEAAAMLERMCPDLAPDERAEAVERAGGWAAAIQLAALSFRAGRHGPGRSRTPRVSSSDKLVDEYVWHEVLSAESDELIDLLLAIAVVPRVNYGLAELLTGDPSAGDLLEQAEARGLFVSSLDAGGWFEVHSLVRDLMLTALRRRSPEGLRQQHARAARWFETMKDGETAARHRLEAGEYDEAVRVLAEVVVDVVDADRGAAVARLLDRVPAEEVGADLDSLIRLAWCELVLGRGRLGPALTAVVSAMDDSAPAVLSDLLAVLRSTATIRSGDWRAGELALRDALDRLDERRGQHPIARHARTQVACAIALDERWDDEGHCEDELRLAASSDARNRIALEAMRALGLARSGRPIEALRAVADVRQADGAGRAGVRSTLGLAEAIVARETGDRGRAGEALERLLAQASPCGHERVLGELELVQLSICGGLPEEAEAHFLEAERAARHELGTTHGRGGVSSSVAYAGVLLGLAQDDLAMAARWSKQVTDPFWAPVGEAKVALAEGRHGDAVEGVARAEPRCPRHEVVGGLVLASALHKEDRDAAGKVVGVALEVAADRGMLQSAASEGAAVADLVELASWRVPDPWMDRLRHVQAPSRVGTATLRWPLEELTSREREVLRLLPSRLTLREVAAELFVSQNTLKFHLRLIYRKLGVGSRAAAVEAARQQGLLQRT